MSQINWNFLWDKLNPQVCTTRAEAAVIFYRIYNKYSGALVTSVVYGVTGLADLTSKTHHMPDENAELANGLKEIIDKLKL